MMMMATRISPKRAWLRTTMISPTRKSVAADVEAVAEIGNGRTIAPTQQKVQRALKATTPKAKRKVPKTRLPIIRKMTAKTSPSAGVGVEAVVAAVATRELDPYTAADRLLAEIG